MRPSTIVAIVLVVGFLAGCSSALQPLDHRFREPILEGRDAHACDLEPDGLDLWTQVFPLTPSASGNVTIPSDVTGTVTFQAATQDGRHEARTIETHGFAVHVAVTTSGLSVVSRQSEVKTSSSTPRVRSHGLGTPQPSPA